MDKALQKLKNVHRCLTTFQQQNITDSRMCVQKGYITVVKLIDLSYVKYSLVLKPF